MSLEGHPPDRGCALHPRCLECPEPQCVEDTLPGCRARSVHPSARRPPSRRGEAVLLRGQGLSLRAIARRLGVTRQCVSGWLKRARALCAESPEGGGIRVYPPRRKFSHESEI